MFLLTGLITALHFLAIYPLFFLAGILMFFLTKPNVSSHTDKEILAHWAVLFLTFLIWSCVFGAKCLVNKAHKVFKAKKYQRCRNNILIGLSFIAVLSLFAADGLPELSNNEMNLLNLFAPISLISAVYVFFIMDSSTQCKWDTKRPSFEFIIFAVLLIANHSYCFFSSRNFYVIEYYRNTCFLQITYFFVVMSSSLEIYAILMGKLVLLDNEEVSLEAVVVIQMAPVTMNVGTQCDASECDEEAGSVSGSDDDEEEEYTSSSEDEEDEDSRSTIYIDFEIECEPRDDDLEEEEHVICMVCDGPPGW